MAELHILPLDQDARQRLARARTEEESRQYRATLMMSLANNLTVLEREVTDAAFMMQQLGARPDSESAVYGEMSQKIKRAIEDLTYGQELLLRAATAISAP